MSFALKNISSLLLQNYYLKMHPPRCSWWGPLNSIKILAESSESSYLFWYEPGPVLIGSAKEHVFRVCGRELFALISNELALD